MKELDLFEKYLSETNHSLQTIEAYLRTVGDYYAHFDRLSKKNLLRYRSYLIGNYSWSSVNAKISALNLYLKHKEKYHWSLKRVRPPQNQFTDNIITMDEYVYLKQCLSGEPDKKWFFIVWFLGATGVRISELLSITADEIINDKVIITGKMDKVRRIFVPENLSYELLKWMKQNDISTGYLFPNRKGLKLHRATVNKILKNFAVKYNMNPNVVYPHSFRHLYAKTFLSVNGDIALLADMLGHTNVETTRIYLRKSAEEVKSIINKTVTW